jgi:hypothetical protein
VNRSVVTAALVLGGVLAMSFGAAGAVQARVLDDTGSTSARADALQYFLSNVGDYMWLGRGLNGSFEVSDNAGLGTSLESAALMYSVDLGVAVALIYFGVMAWISLRPFRRSTAAGITGPAMAAFVVPQSFSALSGTTAAPMTVWITFALAGFCALKVTLGIEPPNSAPLKRGARSAQAPALHGGARVGSGRGSP